MHDWRTPATRPVEILLVEDNAADVRLTQEALREGKIRNRLSVVEDGEVAMRYLRREGEFADATRPDVVLLDLNLPRKNGREVLREMKGDERLQNIPVVVLSSSEAEQDVIAAYNLHANCYVTKPVDLDQFVRAIQSIEQFWFTIVRLPPE